MSPTLFSQRCSRPSVSLPNKKSFKRNKNENLGGCYCFTNTVVAVESNFNLSIVFLLLLKVGTPGNRDGFINRCPSSTVQRVTAVVLQQQKKKRVFGATIQTSFIHKLVESGQKYTKK